MRMWNDLARAVGGAALILSIAAPAAAGKIYAWRTDDGGYAFTDDASRIPRRYRERARVRELGSMRSYPRFTPQDDAAAERHARDLQVRLERFRSQNGPRPEPDAGMAEPIVAIRTGADEEPVVEVISLGGSGEPIVIEEKRVRVPGTFVTRENRIVRQGDRVLAIIKPRATGVGHTTSLFFDDDQE